MPTSLRQTSRPVRLLIVEDDEDERMLILRILQPHGYDLQVAADGAEALRMARRLEPQVVILDLHLPIIDGFEVLAELKGDAYTNDVSVLVVSASDREVDVVRALELGATDYVAKPVARSILLARLGAILRSRREKQTLWELGEDLRRAQEELAVTRRATALASISAGLAHEINNPLAFVITDMHGVREISDELRDLGHYEHAEALRALAEEALEGMHRIRDVVRDMAVLASTVDHRGLVSAGSVDPAIVLTRRVDRLGGRVRLEVRGSARIAAAHGNEDEFDALCGLLLRQVIDDPAGAPPSVRPDSNDGRPTGPRSIQFTADGQVRSHLTFDGKVARVAIETVGENVRLLFESADFIPRPPERQERASVIPGFDPSLALAIGRELADRFGGTLEHVTGCAGSQRIELNLPARI